MKKIVAFLVFTIAAFSYTTSDAQAFMKGTKTINLGVGLGYGLGFLGSAEVGVADDISAGIVAGVSRRAFGSLGFNYNVNYIVIGARGSYHLGRILADAGVNVDKLDPYVGLTGGFRNVNVGGTFGDVYSGSGTGIMLGGYAGIRYQLNDKFAVMAEGGAPLSTIGISFEL